MEGGYHHQRACYVSQSSTSRAPWSLIHAQMLTNLVRLLDEVLKLIERQFFLQKITSEPLSVKKMK